MLTDLVNFVASPKWIPTTLSSLFSEALSYVTTTTTPHTRVFTADRTRPSIFLRVDELFPYRSSAAGKMRATISRVIAGNGPESMANRDPRKTSDKRDLRTAGFLFLLFPVPQGDDLSPRRIARSGRVLGSPSLPHSDCVAIPRLGTNPE